MLKAHQLFYYGKMSHRTAYGVMNLHGYKVLRGKTKEKKFYFSAVPADKSQKEYNFYTETDAERDRYTYVLATCDSLGAGMSLIATCHVRFFFVCRWMQVIRKSATRTK